jgi:hypothetical protein
MLCTVTCIASVYWCSYERMHYVHTNAHHVAALCEHTFSSYHLCILCICSAQNNCYDDPGMHAMALLITSSSAPPGQGAEIKAHAHRILQVITTTTTLITMQFQLAHAHRIL